MANSPFDRVVVATRFSRLRASTSGTGPASDLNIPYEALSTLAEAMDVLTDSLNAIATKQPVDLPRVHRLKERAAWFEDGTQWREFLNAMCHPPSVGSDAPPAASSTAACCRASPRP